MTEAKIVPSQNDLTPPSASGVKLLRITLHNFLSFEHDTVELNPQFSVITGPNGAGKSSIYQALKFVLGSNNYDGRYSKWAEFIHTGCEMAQVQLEFSLNGDVHGIQREVFTDRSIKFYIRPPNTPKYKPAPANVIKELIDKTGIDPENIFTFMSQGSIDTIKNFKEQELCTFVEKGVGLYQIRTQIIERKNYIETLNLRYNALIAQLHSYQHQLRELEPKLKRLQQKKDYQTKLIALNDELLWAQRDQIQAEIDRTSHSLKQIQVQLALLNVKKVELERQESEISSQAQDKIQALAELEANYSNLTRQIKEIQKRLDETATENSKLADRIQKLKEEIKQHHEGQAKLDTEIKGQAEKITQIDLKITDLQAGIVTRRKEEMEFRKELDTFQAKMTEYEKKKTQIQYSQNDLTRIQTDHKEVEEKINSKVQEIKKWESQKKQLAWLLTDENEDPETKFKTLERDTESKMEIVSNQIEDLQAKYEHIQKDIKEIKQNLTSKDFDKPESIKRIKEIIKSRELDAVGPVIDYISFKDQHQAAIQSLFNEFVLHSFVANSKDAHQILLSTCYSEDAKCNVYKAKNRPIQHLAPLKAGELDGVFGYLVDHIEISPGFPEIEKLVYSIAGKTILVKDRISALNYIDQIDDNDPIVTLDGEQFRNRMYVIESRTNTRKKKMLPPANARLELERYEQIQSENRANADKLMKTKANLSKDLEKIKEALQKAPTLKFILHSLSISTSTKNNLINQRQALYNKENDLEQQIQKMEEECEQIQAMLPPNLMEKRKRLNEIPQEITTLEDQKDQMLTSRNNYQAKIMELSTNLTQIKTEQHFLEQEKDQLEKSLKEKDGKVFHDLQEINNLKQQAEEMGERKEKIRNAVQEVKDLLDQKKKEIKAVSDQIMQADMEACKLSSVIKDKRTKLDELASKMRQQPQKDVVLKPIDVILKEIAFNENALRSYIDVDESLEQEKCRLESNLAQITQKQTEIERELSDAKITEKELEHNYYLRFRGRLEELERTMNYMFIDADLAANIHLALTGDFEALKLRIESCYASTFNLPLSALSGGQRSMVGICLMLSLHRLNPSPFCIYDEVDMFLDPNNAQKVATLIHNLTNKGMQFVILMPNENKTLLQLADKVIGVTRNGKTGPSMIFYGKW